MLKLIKLELKKNKINTYLWAIFIIGLSMFFMLLLLAFLPYMDDGSDMMLFSRYGSIDIMICIIEMCAFSILAAVMYSRFLIEEYAGKRVFLLFTYPLNRQKVFYAKVILVTIFSAGAMFVLNIFMFGLFYGIEVFTGVVNDSLNFATLLHTLFVSALLSVIAGVIGIASARVGFAKKSMQATIVTSVIISCCLCQMVVPCIDYIAILIGIFALVSVIGIFILVEFAKKVECMEEAL